MPVANSETARRLVSACATLLAIALLAACATPWYFRIDEIHPSELSTSAPGPSGEFGACLEAQAFLPFQAPVVPLPGGQVLVGYDNRFEPGTEPFPCHRIRASLWRGYVTFPLDKYDSIISAFLLFDTVRSLDRYPDKNPQRMFASVPGESYATRVGMPGANFAIVDAVPVRGRLPVEAHVTDHVSQWISGAVANEGFVIANGDDVLPLSPTSLPRKNDAKISWYANFRLRVLYNVPDNPRTPQR
jgi:hypothetical protein